MSGILLGYELGTGSPVTIPFHHLVATGVTGLSGKTTTLEALISRAGMRAIAFRTKRGETGFEDARLHAPYYRERSDWQYVSMLLEATMREKMRFERSWIIKVSKGTHGLREVLDNVKLAKKTAKGLNESVYTNLEAYLEIVVPQIESAGIVHDLSVGEGVTVMDLEGMTDEMQSLVIASTLESWTMPALSICGTTISRYASRFVYTLSLSPFAVFFASLTLSKTSCNPCVPFDTLMIHDRSNRIFSRIVASRSMETYCQSERSR